MKPSRAGLALAIVLLALAVAPVPGLWAAAHAEYPHGLNGAAACFVDCVRLGWGLYQPPLNTVHLANGPGLTALIPPQRVDEHRFAGMGECASIAQNRQGLVQLAWMMRDPRDGQTYKVYGRQMNSKGTFRGPDYRLNTGGSAGLLAHHVSLHVDGRGVFTVLWHAARNPAELVHHGAGVYLRRISAEGVAGHEIRVSAGDVGAMAEAAVAPSNRLAVVWTEDGALWGRVVLPDDTMLAPVRLDQNPPGAVAEFPAVAVADNGTVLVAWVDTREGRRDVWVRVLGPDLQPGAPPYLLGQGPVPTAFFRLISVTHTSRGFAVLWMAPGAAQGRWVTDDGRPGRAQQAVFAACGEAAQVPQDDGSVLASNGRLVTRWGPDRVTSSLDLLPPPSNPHEISLAQATDGGTWIAWHEALDSRRFPALGDNYYIMAAKVRYELRQPPPHW